MWQFYCNVGQAQLQSSVATYFYKGSKRYYKVEQLIHCKMWQSLLHRGACITKSPWDRYYRLGQELWQSGQVIFYKVGQLLLQSGIGIIKWGNFIAKWDNYYRKGQYIFVTLEQMETHVYRQRQCGLRTEFWGLLIFGRLSTKQFLLMFVFRRLKFIRFKKV